MNKNKIRFYIVVLAVPFAKSATYWVCSICELRSSNFAELCSCFFMYLLYSGDNSISPINLLW